MVCCVVVWCVAMRCTVHVVRAVLYLKFFVVFSLLEVCLMHLFVSLSGGADLGGDPQGRPGND